MAFTPKYGAEFIKPFITALESLIENNIEDALTWANGAAGLPSFAAYYRAVPKTNVKFPVCVIRPGRTRLAQAEDDGFIQNVHEVFIEVGLIDSDPDALASNMMTYVRAVDAIIRTAPAANVGEQPGAPQLVADFDSLPAKRGPLEWEVTQHLYDEPVFNDQKSYVMVAQLTVAFAIKEVIG